MRDVKSWHVRQVTAPVADHGEGPVWDEERGRLLWVDMLAGDLLDTNPLTGETVRHQGPEDVAAILCRDEKEWLLTGRHHIWRGDLDNWDKCASLPLSRDERANEGGCSEKGELYIGTMREDEATGTGAIYRYDGQTVTASLAGTTISNGVAFTAGGCWFIDSPTRSIRWYKISEDGRWEASEKAFSTEEFPGIPDGMCRDSEGGFWVAMYGGGSVIRFTASGEPDAVIKIPAECPTSCCFGGDGGAELFVTTSRYKRDQSLDPQAGSLFAVTTGFQGAKRHAFAPVEFAQEIPSADHSL
ncbi:SMP-30/gluconolactonase/LRE family protein [Paenarthrobacter sp. NPDC057981]|uniref:SMP-30/gluconolactonase/LRE family protein n=1 Tax=Paenarthrobacter sp. NPDC057981 TaxID=3346297 RepID=UPI0036DD9F27